MYKVKKEIEIVRLVNEFDDASTVLHHEETSLDEIVYILECIKLTRKELEKDQTKDNFNALLLNYQMIGSQIDKWLQLLSAVNDTVIISKKAA